MQLLRKRSLLVVLLGLTVLFTVGFIGTVFRDAEIRKEITRLERRARELEGRKARSLDLLEEIQGTAHAEAEARMRLGLKKPGEKVLVVPPIIGTTSTPRDGDGRAANWEQWWKYFFGPERPK